MSLQVWLPLTKDLRNQGLNNISVTNHNATYTSTGGKLGGYYGFNGSSYYITFPQGYLGQKWSYSIWFYTGVSNINQCLGCCRTTTGQGFSIFLIGNKLRIDRGGGDNSTQWTTNYTITLNTWTHLTITCDTNIIKYYINGELEESSTTTLNSNKWGTIFSVGASQAGGNNYTNYFKGRLNDVRVYDHCLSPMEVKQISQGLVLHYPLSGGNLIDINDVTDGYYLNSSGNATSINGWCYTDYIPIYSNSKYVCTGLSSGGSGTYVVLYNSSKTKTRTLLLTANQNLNITTNDTEKYIRISVRKIANELTTTARFIYLEPIVYDCSGYCNNGSRITDTFTYNYDTAKYCVSTNFNGTYDGILIENLALKDIINSAVTYAFWIKPNGEAGARSVYFGSYSTGPSWSIEKTTGNVIRSYWNGSPDETCSGATITDGIWQHVCLVKNGTNDIKVYINGVQKWASTATHSNLNFPTTFRIGRDTRSNDGTPYKGLMSDFRIYATALSADDVKSLYQNCATIDPDGTIRGQIRS